MVTAAIFVSRQSLWHCFSYSFPAGASLPVAYLLPTVTDSAWQKSRATMSNLEGLALYAMTSCPLKKNREKEIAVPAGRRGPGCARCWWSPGCPWLPHSFHSICARLGTAVPGQRESSVYSLFLRTLKRQRCTYSYITCMWHEQRHSLTQSALLNCLSQLKIFKTRLRVIDYHPFREKLT